MKAAVSKLGKPGTCSNCGNWAFVLLVKSAQCCGTCRQALEAKRV